MTPIHRDPGAKRSFPQPGAHTRLGDQPPMPTLLRAVQAARIAVVVEGLDWHYFGTGLIGLSCKYWWTILDLNQ